MFTHYSFGNSDQERSIILIENHVLEKSTCLMWILRYKLAGTRQNILSRNRRGNPIHGKYAAKTWTTYLRSSEITFTSNHVLGLTSVSLHASLEQLKASSPAKVLNNKSIVTFLFSFLDYSFGLLSNHCRRQ